MDTVQESVKRIINGFMGNVYDLMDSVWLMYRWAKRRGIIFRMCSVAVI